MTLDQANAIVDQLNAVFAGNSTEIPSAESIHGALERFNLEVTGSGFDAKAIPDKIKKNEAQINRELASTVSAIRDHANEVVRVAASKKSLEQLLAQKAPSVSRAVRL